MEIFHLGQTNSTGEISLGKLDRFSIKRCYDIYANKLPKIMI